MVEEPSEPIVRTSAIAPASAVETSTSAPVQVIPLATPGTNGADGADGVASLPDFVGILRRPMTVRLTPMTIVLVFMAAILLVFLVNALGQLLDLMLLFFLGVTIALSLQPAVASLMRRGLGRGLATAVLYLGIIAALCLTFYFIISPLVEEAADLSKSAPTLPGKLYDKLPPPVQERVDPFIAASVSAAPTPLPGAVITSSTAVGGTTITSTTTLSTPNLDLNELLAPANSSALWRGLFGIIGGLGSAVLSIIFAMIVSLYWLMAEDKPQQLFLTIVNPKNRAYTSAVLSEIAWSMGAWLRGTLLLCLIIGVMSYVGLLWIGVPFALLLAVLAGLMEMIPTIGSLLGEIPAIIIGFAAGGWEMAFAVFILYSVIQNIEGWLIVPRVMGKAVNIPGLLVLTAVVTWGTLFGFLGALLAVPLTALLAALFRRLLLPALQQRAAAAQAAESV